MLLPVIVLLTVLMGCADGGAAEDALRLNEADSGKRIHIYPNGEFTIVLESNPTTGYMWAVVEIDDSIVKVIRNDYFADPAPEMITGSGGREEWMFCGVQTGTSVVKMQYRRSWEPDDPDGEFTLTVDVE